MMPGVLRDARFFEGSASQMRGSLGTLERKEAVFGWKLISPTVIMISLLILYPVVYNIYLSFFNVSLNPQVADQFVGIENYIKLLADSEFWRSFGVTIAFTLITVGGSIVLGVGVALLMNRKFVGRGIVRALILLPYVTPLISLVFAWRYVFLPLDGPLVQFLSSVNLMNPGTDIINNPNNAFLVVSFFNVWRNFPFVYLMTLATLQSIPDTLYEAAEIDGASRWKQFTAVTLPELYFVLASVALLRGIWNFYKFDEVYLLSKFAGVLSIFVYETAFSGVPRQGVAASAATLLFVIMMVMILVYVKKVLKW